MRPPTHNFSTWWPAASVVGAWLIFAVVWAGLGG